MSKNVVETEWPQTMSQHGAYALNSYIVLKQHVLSRKHIQFRIVNNANFLQIHTHFYTDVTEAAESGWRNKRVFVISEQNKNWLLGVGLPVCTHLQNSYHRTWIS
jgi:hypothetical protein